MKRGVGAIRSGFSSFFSGFRKADFPPEASGDGDARITEEPFTLLPT